tara:strand:- start:185 stop:406 length:222 start_codon:yes stop_codon:yes gene_type:complete
MEATLKEIDITDDLEFQLILKKEPILGEMLTCVDKKKFKQLGRIAAASHGKEWCQYAWSYLLMSIKENTGDEL